MSRFSLGLHTRNLGTATRQVSNPFTQEAITVHIDNGMTPAEKKASLKTLRDAGASEADEDGFKTVQLAGKSYACIRLDGIGGEIDVEGKLTLEIATFVFRLALAAGMFVTSPRDPDVIAVLPGQRHASIDTRWPNAADVDSADALMEWIRAERKAGRTA